jgi:hypothetical protein
MNYPINDSRHPWARLARAAGSVRDERDASAPYGFSTRMAALAFAQEQKIVSLFDRFALRALGVACLLALGSVAMNYGALTGSTPDVVAFASTSVDEVLMPTSDAGLLLEIAD